MAAAEVQALQEVAQAAAASHDAELQQLQGQIDLAMRRAMYELISSTVSKEQLTEADADWLARLLKELVDRLNALTPHRSDFHEQLERAIDVQLARQMLLHGAADRSDVTGLIAVVHERLRLLVAPVQDADVEDMRSSSLSEEHPARMLAMLLCKADAILGYTEELNRQVASEVEAYDDYVG